MKYTAIKKRACSSVWKDKNGIQWSYLPLSSAKEQNVSHKDIIGDIPLKNSETAVGELYSEEGNQSCSIAQYREKLKYSEQLKGYIPCQSEEGQQGYVRVLGTAVGKILAPIIAAVIILAGAAVAAWYFTTDFGPPLDKAAIAYQMPNGLRNEDPNQIMLPGFSKLTMNAQTGQVKAALVNPEGNPCYFTYVIVLKDTGEELYRTGLLEPGTAVTEFTIEKDLAVGSYDVELRVETGQLSDYTKEMNSGVIATTLEVVQE